MLMMGAGGGLRVSQSEKLFVTAVTFSLVADPGRGKCHDSQAIEIDLEIGCVLSYV